MVRHTQALPHSSSHPYRSFARNWIAARNLEYVNALNWSGVSILRGTTKLGWAYRVLSENKRAIDIQLVPCFPHVRWHLVAQLGEHAAVHLPCKLLQRRR